MNNREIVLSELGHFDPSWKAARHFVIEFGSPESPPVYSVQAPTANRRAAQLLISKGADIVIATAERFYWISGNEALPAEDFELRKVVLARPTRLTADEVAAFKDITTITWLELNECDDSVLALLQFMPRLRRLSIKGGQHYWQPLKVLQDGHPLRMIELNRVTINERQLAPVFDVAALEEVKFIGMGLEPEIGSLFPKQKLSLRKLEVNGSGPLTTAGFRNLRLLKELRRLMLYPSVAKKIRR